jgi:FlaA1/EpsC-like NDP-sugar epimerase
VDKLSRKPVMLGIDALLTMIAACGAVLLRFEGFPPQMQAGLASLLVPLVAARLVSFYFFGMYRRVWEYASIGELLATIKAVTVGTVISGFFTFAVIQQSIPRSVVALEWMLSIFLVGGSRLVWRMIRDGQGISRKTAKGKGKPVLIIGAGDGGVLAARELRNHYRDEVYIVGFIDDDPAKQNQQIFGCPILGTRQDITQVVQEYRVEEVVIAMPSVERRVLREIVEICQETPAKIKILPGMYDLIDGKVTVNEIREVQVEDLLRREPVRLDIDSIAGYISGKVVLVTGGGGSIGSELCRQIVTYQPKMLLLLDICENNVYDIEMELRAMTDVPIVPLVKNVQDQAAVNEIFRTYRPKVVFHAAAHKHVPLMEVNPEEAIKNNAMGTFFVAQAANLYSSDVFVLVSTDKAVNPTSIMGASKRIAEMIIQHLDRISKTKFVAVRFGNVLGSRGSVVPLFKKQIAAGGPVTVTDERMIRYFMTIPEAVQLIIQAGALANGGEIFVLDMGDPVRILDLAKTLIRLSGFEPGVDIPIQITGMRPGEKLYEELLTAEEGTTSTTNERIFVARPTELNTVLIEETLRNFVSGVLPVGEEETVAFIQGFLPEFELIRPSAPKPSQEALADSTAASLEVEEEHP